MIDLTKKLLFEISKAFEAKKNLRGLFEFLITILFYFLCLIAIYVVREHSVILAALLCVLASLFLVRCFVVQHDCSHGSLFPKAWANRLVGRLLSLLTLTPFSAWRWQHLIHHHTCGNLDQRGVGDVFLLTVKEFNQLSKKKQLRYRILRHPLFIFIAGPLYFIFILRFNQKSHTQHKHYSKKVGRSIFLTDISLIFFYTIAFYFLGAQFLLVFYLPIICCATVFGTWLFFVQHDFPEAYFESDKERSHVDAALKGSSYYKLPRILAWLTAYIGYHHIHHLFPKIPSYHLKKCFDDNDFLQSPVTYRLKDTLVLSRLMLYDEEMKRVISWTEYKKLY